VLERAHVVQPVGELDDDDAKVGDHGEKHLANVFSLVVFAVGELDLVELGDAFDDVRDLLAEALGDLCGGNVGVFDGIVQQAGRDGRGIHLQFGQHLRYFKRMADVSLAGGAELAFMLLDAEGPTVADEVEVVGWPVGAHGLEQVGEAGVEFRVFGCRRCGLAGRLDYRGESAGWSIELRGLNRRRESRHKGAGRCGSGCGFVLRAGFAGVERERVFCARDRRLRARDGHGSLYGDAEKSG
jgi:hypothetical protein